LAWLGGANDSAQAALIQNAFIKTAIAAVSQAGDRGLATERFLPGTNVYSTP
jgi:hypothetical protein